MVFPALALTLAAPRQDASLDAFLMAHPPTGAWVAVDPARVRADGSGRDLAAFGRKAVPVGRLTAVVPTTMVVVNDDALAQGRSPDVDLRQPFFPDNALLKNQGREPKAQTEAAARWREFRAEANRRAVESLLASFGNVPALVAARRGGVRYTATPLLPWRPGEPLPTAGRFDPQDPPITAPPLRVEAEPGENGLRTRLAHPETGHPERIALDLSDVPSAKWATVLDRILKRRY